MSKHFENLWINSEQLSTKIRNDSTAHHIVNRIKEDLEIIQDSCPAYKKTEAMGRILFELSALSQKFNIDVYAALNVAMDDLKVEFYEVGA